MAPPKWRKEVMDCFVDECYNMVKDGCQSTNESVFFLRGLKRTCNYVLLMFHLVKRI